jgi:hypothetical protein
MTDPSRAELSPAEEALHPETRAEEFKGNRHTGSLAADNLSFVKNTAVKTSHSERSVQHDATRGTRTRLDHHQPAWPAEPDGGAEEIPDRVAVQFGEGGPWRRPEINPSK